MNGAEFSSVIKKIILYIIHSLVNLTIRLGSYIIYNIYTNASDFEPCNFSNLLTHSLIQKSVFGDKYKNYYTIIFIHALFVNCNNFNLQMNLPKKRLISRMIDSVVHKLY